MLLALAMALALGGSDAQRRVIPMSPYLRYQATLRASVNGVDGVFTFDTGEGVSAISPQFAAAIGCRPWGRITGFRMTGERIATQHCDGLSFETAGVKLQVPTAITLDVMALMGGSVPHLDGAIGLDAFAQRSVTIVPRKCLIMETPRSLHARTRLLRELPVRLVRDAEGVALAVDAAVPTPDGTAWMELDTGNGGSTVVANHIAPLLNMPLNLSNASEFAFSLANGLTVRTPVRTEELIMDGNIGARFLNDWVMTLDLVTGHAWLAPEDPGDCRIE
jgi:hypothetical protein